MSRPGEPGFKPAPFITRPMTIEERIKVLDDFLKDEQNRYQTENIEAVKKDLREKGKTGRYYQKGKEINFEDYDHSDGPIWVEGGYQL